MDLHQAAKTSIFVVLPIVGVFVLSVSGRGHYLMHYH